MEAISFEGGDESGEVIFQNPLFASTLLNICVTASFASVSSIFCRRYSSWRTFSFSSLRSTQIQLAPSFLGTTTIRAHQGVGLSTFEITPIDSMQSSSSFTLDRSGSGTCRGANRQWGAAPGLIHISYSSPMFPSP